MGMAYLPSYIHRCVVPSGPLAGNKAETRVEPFMVEYQTHCEICGELFATPNQIIAYLYDKLTEVHN